MNALTIARWDFRNVRRSRTLWGVTAVLVLTFGSIALTQSGGDSTAAREVVAAAFGAMFSISALLLPVLVLPVAVFSITGERTSGSVKQLLGLPNSRLDPLVGKFLSRSAVAVSGLLAASLLSGGVLWARFGSLPVETFGTFVALSVFYVVVWVAIAVGVSASSRTRGRALAGGLGVYFLFGVIWNFLPGVTARGVAAYVVETLLGLADAPDLYAFVDTLSPTLAYVRAGQGLVFGIELVDTGAGGTPPIYLQSWFGLVILLAWLVVPLAVGYPWFRDAEIG